MLVLEQAESTFTLLKHETWQRIGSRFRGQTASDGFFSFTCPSKSTKDITRKRSTQRIFPLLPSSLTQHDGCKYLKHTVCWGKRVFETWRGPHGPHNHICSHIRVDAIYNPLQPAPHIQWCQIIYLQSSELTRTWLAFYSMWDHSQSHRKSPSGLIWLLTCLQDMKDLRCCLCIKYAKNM